MAAWRWGGLRALQALCKALHAVSGFQVAVWHSMSEVRIAARRAAQLVFMQNKVPVSNLRGQQLSNTSCCLPSSPPRQSSSRLLKPRLVNFGGRHDGMPWRSEAALRVRVHPCRTLMTCVCYLTTGTRFASGVPLLATSAQVVLRCFEFGMIFWLSWKWGTAEQEG